MDEAEFNSRPPAPMPAAVDGTGRELFALMRHASDTAEQGACPLLAAAGL
jgi:phosphogluconate dehydratase